MFPDVPGFVFGVPWWFALVFGIILFIIIVRLVRGAQTWMSNNASPIVTVPAKVIGKRTKTTGGANNTGVSTIYYISFQFENGERQEFRISGHEYGLLVESDAGLLTHQGTRYHGFQRRT